VLFGSSFLSVVAAVNYATRAFLPLRMWAMAIATMTAIVGLGQIIGPIVTGWLADMFGLSNGLALSPASLVLGSAIAFAGSILHARHRP
jgi:MFS family permease